MLVHVWAHITHSYHHPTQIKLIYDGAQACIMVCGGRVEASLNLFMKEKEGYILNFEFSD